MSREDFLEEVVLDLSLDTDEKEAKVSARSSQPESGKGVWGNVGRGTLLR